MWDSGAPFSSDPTRFGIGCNQVVEGGLRDMTDPFHGVFYHAWKVQKGNVVRQETRHSNFIGGIENCRSVAPAFQRLKGQA
jgi:hypothetical protein